MPLKINQIKTDDRQRKDYGDIETLAENIQERGLLQPIGINKDNVLIWGGRRLEALKHLGWKELTKKHYVTINTEDELELRELELIENTCRQGLHWSEEVQAKREIDRLKKQKFGDSAETGSYSSWSTRKSASLLGESTGGFSEDVNLAQALDTIPELGKCETKSEAKRMLKRMVNDYERYKNIEGDTSKAVSSGEVSSPKRNRDIEFADSHFRIGDAREELPRLQETHAYFAEVDPPYAEDLPEMLKSNPHRKNASSHKNYQEIDPKKYMALCTEIATELHRILGKNAWMIWWFSWKWYEQLYTMLTKTGFHVDKVPSMWYKGSDPQGTMNAKYLPYRDYEQFFLCRKGDAVIEKMHGTTYVHKTSSKLGRTCSAEKPVSLYEEILETLVPNSPKIVAICPFLGSGAFLRALYNKGHAGIGWDLSEENKNYFLKELIQNGVS
jgi:hypothetical protein